MTTNRLYTKRIASCVAAALSIWTSCSSAAYGPQSITVDGTSIRAETIDGQTVIGSVDSQSVKFVGTSYALLAGYNSSGPIDEHVIVHGKNIDFYGTNPDQGIVWARGEGVTSNLTLGDTTTDKISIVSTGAKGIALWASGGNGVGSSLIDVSGKLLEINSAYGGIAVQNNGEQDPPPALRSVINLNSDNTIITAKEMGITAWSNGVVNVNSNLVVNAKNALDVRGNSDVAINLDGKHSTVLNGDIVFETPNSPEDAQNSGKLINANVKINLTGKNSSWTGSAYQYYKVNGEYQKNIELEAEPYHGNVTGFEVIIENGAEWNMTDASFINTVTLNEGGTINVNEDVSAFNASDVVLSGGSLNLQGNTTVAVNTVSGTGGAINLQATTDDGKTFTSGKVNVKNVQTVNDETPHIVVAFTGVNADQVEDATLALQQLNESVVADGATKTNMISEGDVTGTLVQEVTSAGDLGEVKEMVNQKLDGYSSIAALSAVQWRHENDTLLKRMGELRDAHGTVGAWARIYGSEQEYGAQSVTAKNTTVQVGADYDVGSGWKVGGAFSYTDGSSSFDMGESDSNMYGVAVYGTWFADNGQFVDLIAKYSRLSNEFTSGTMKGDFDNNAFSVAAEYGWHFALNDVSFIEPSAGVTYGRIMGDDFMANNGVKVEQDDYDSLIGRLGVRSGFYFPNQKGTVYARAAVLHDFMGDMESTVSKAGKVAHLKDELGDTWFEYGIGANFNLTNATYTFVDLEKTAGGDIKEDWRWNIGLRTVF